MPARLTPFAAAEFSALRTDFALRQTSPTASTTAATITTLVPPPPPRVPLAAVTNTASFAQSVRKSADAFAALTQATPVQSFASRLRRPETPGRPRRTNM